VAKHQNRERIKSEIARLLSEERQRRGLSMNELAARSGLSQSSISGFESLKANPTLDSLLRISEVLEVNLGKILDCAIKSQTRDG
jgi:XRE family transcriptional regulator, master regulator for biofilm formation